MHFLQLCVCELVKNQHIKSRKLKWIIKSVLNAVDSVDRQAIAIEKSEPCSMWCSFVRLYIFRKDTQSSSYIFIAEQKKNRQYLTLLNDNTHMAQWLMSSIESFLLLDLKWSSSVVLIIQLTQMKHAPAY